MEGIMTGISERWRSLAGKIAAIGGAVEDPDLRTQKVVLVILSLSAIPIGIIWTPIEFSFGDTNSALITAIIAAVVLANFLFYSAHKNYHYFRFSQLIIFLSFPIVLHVSLGGFTKSANLIWSFATPLIGLLSSKPREGTFWFLSFLGIVALGGLAEPGLFPENGMSMETAFFEFSFNIINVSIIIYLMLIYLLREKNRAFDLLEAEKQESERLLLNVLPKEIAPRLKNGNRTIADRYGAASILFADIVDFTPISMHMSAEDMVALLNQIFTHFDSLVDKYDLEKIRTIGDSYMVASGLPRPREDHAQALASLALDMTEFVNTLPARNGDDVNIRVGINSGSVVAGVIGKRKFQYDVWGDMVNTASRMESHGTPGRIQVTDRTYALLKDAFDFEQRGCIDIKGKGEMNTWYLLGRKSMDLGVQ
jgi:guanylate cyclase